MYRIIGADGQEYGPVSAEQVRQWLAEGRANAQTRIRLEGSSDWQPLGQLAEFFPPEPQAGAAATSPPPFSVSAPPRNNPLAVTGMVLGVLSVTVGCCCYGLPFNLAGVVISGMALVQINQDPQRERGKGLALAGLVLSILGILLGVLSLVFGLAANRPDFWHRLQRL